MKPFTYDTYQDVRTNLFYYSAIGLNLAGFAAYQWVLPDPHRWYVSGLFEALLKNPLVSGLVAAGAGLAVFTAVAFVLVEIVKVHDRSLST